MSKHTRIHSFFCLFLLCSAFLLCACSRKPGEAQPAVTPLLGSGSFSLAAESLGTWAEGSVLVYEKEKDRLGIQIVALFEVGPEDWGGVAFSLPAGCALEGIRCTYPEDGEGAEAPVNAWSTGSENEKFTLTVEVARSRSQEPRGGGTGTVVIDAVLPLGSQSPPASLDFAAECGGRVKNGSVCWGEAHEEITVELKS